MSDFDFDKTTYTSRPGISRSSFTVLNQSDEDVANDHGAISPIMRLAIKGLSKKELQEAIETLLVERKEIRQHPNFHMLRELETVADWDAKRSNEQLR